MKEFIVSNASTITVAIIVSAIIIFALVKIIKNRKSGKCSCGCEDCSFKDNCHKK